MLKIDAAPRLSKVLWRQDMSPGWYVFQPCTYLVGRTCGNRPDMFGHGRYGRYFDGEVKSIEDVFERRSMKD